MVPNREVAKNHQAVECDHCQLWVHITLDVANKITLITLITLFLMTIMKKRCLMLYCSPNPN